MRSASISLIGGLRRQGLDSSEPSETLTPAWKKRHTRNVRGAIDSKMFDTLLLIPLIIAAITITTITPMATPRMVSAARPLLLRSESSAMPTPSNRLVMSRAVGPRSGRAGPIAALRHETRSEEHTSELQSLRQLVCRLLLEKKK